MDDLRLKPGKVYRTEDLYRYGKNPTRLAEKLVRAGQLRRLRKGVYYAPQGSAFGEVPPSESEFFKSYFRGRPYLQTGPSVWNALGLGTTAVEVVSLIYNTTRTGQLQLGSRHFELRRVRFPRRPTAEYFVVDLLENADRAGMDLETVRRALKAAMMARRFDSKRILAMASKYGTRFTQRFVHDTMHDDTQVPR